VYNSAKTEIHQFLGALEKVYIPGLDTCSCPLNAVAVRVYPTMADFDPQVSHPLDGYSSQTIDLAQYFDLHVVPQMVNYSYDPDNTMAPRFTEASASAFNGHDVTRDEPKPAQVGLIFKFRIFEKLTLLSMKLTSNEVLPLHMKNAINHSDFNGNPEQLRKILRSQYGEQAQACKLFSKEVKQCVTSTQVLQASAARRKCEARFVCPIEGCTSNLPDVITLTVSMSLFSWYQIVSFKDLFF